MCKFCDERVMAIDGPLVPMFDEKIWLGPAVPRVSFQTALCESGDDAVIEYYLDGTSVASQYVNYCPMCGRSLKGESEDV